MSLYSEEDVRKKLQKLDSSIHSIQGLSQWIIYHRKRHVQSVDVWKSEFSAAVPDRKLVLFYLANDIVQVSRRRGPEFVDSFKAILSEVVDEFMNTSGDEIIAKVKRVLKIWEERQVFPAEFLRSIMKTSAPSATAEQSAPERDSDGYQGARGSPVLNPALMSPSMENQESVRHNSQTSVSLPNIDVPEPTDENFEELLNLLSELREERQKKTELKASLDALSSSGVEEKLQVLRKGELNEIGLLVSKIDEDKQFLTSYRTRLENENDKRKRIQALFAAHIGAQKSAIQENETISSTCDDLIKSNDVIRQKAQQRLDQPVLNKGVLAAQTTTTKRAPAEKMTSFNDYKRMKLTDDLYDEFAAVPPSAQPQAQISSPPQVQSQAQFSSLPTGQFPNQAQFSSPLPVHSQAQEFSSAPSLEPHILQQIELLKMHLQQQQPPPPPPQQQQQPQRQPQHLLQHAPTQHTQQHSPLHAQPQHVPLQHLQQHVPVQYTPLQHSQPQQIPTQHHLRHVQHQQSPRSKNVHYQPEEPHGSPQQQKRQKKEHVGDHHVHSQPVIFKKEPGTGHSSEPIPNVSSSQDLPFSLQILGLPSKSRVETRMKMCLRLLTNGTDNLCTRWPQLELDSHLVVPQFLRRKTTNENKDNTETVGGESLMLSAQVFNSDLTQTIQRCYGCIQRERKSLEKKLKDKDVLLPQSPVTLESEKESILQFYSEPTINFTTGEAIIPLRLTCYCRHHREHKGFLIRITLQNSATKEIVASTLSSLVMITDDRKSQKKRITNEEKMGVEIPDPEPTKVKREQTIERLIPTEGPVSGGIEVTVLGTGFHSGLRCVFGTEEAPKTQLWGDATLIATLPPALCAGPVAVTLRDMKNPGQQIRNFKDVLFTYINDSNKQLFELALQVIGMKLTGRIDNPTEIARTIVASSQDGRNFEMGSKPNNHSLRTNSMHSMNSVHSMNSMNSGEDEGIIELHSPLSSSSYITKHNFSRKLDQAVIVKAINQTAALRTSFPTDLSVQNKRGQTILHLATANNLSAIFDAVLAASDDSIIGIDLQDNNGWTALHFAAYHGHSDFVRRLLEAGASPLLNNENGDIPCDLATDPEIIRLLSPATRGRMNITSYPQDPVPISGQVLAALSQSADFGGSSLVASSSSETLRPISSRLTSSGSEAVSSETVRPVSSRLTSSGSGSLSSSSSSSRSGSISESGSGSGSVSGFGFGFGSVSSSVSGFGSVSSSVSETARPLAKLTSSDPPIARLPLHRMSEGSPRSSESVKSIHSTGSSSNSGESSGNSRSSSPLSRSSESILVGSEDSFPSSTETASPLSASQDLLTSLLESLSSPFSDSLSSLAEEEEPHSFASSIVRSVTNSVPTTYPPSEPSLPNTGTKERLLTPMDSITGLVSLAWVFLQHFWSDYRVFLYIGLLAATGSWSLVDYLPNLTGTTDLPTISLEKGLTPYTSSCNPPVLGCGHPDFVFPQSVHPIEEKAWSESLQPLQPIKNIESYILTFGQFALFITTLFLILFHFKGNLGVFRFWVANFIVFSCFSLGSIFIFDVV
eukprot:TRINITY_DN1239_c0_g1_i6.p1 TRINITY_DN1239_c0_g1~~TRINITY_DN1239_c0_g1_i6.p1  ORF type:complete len:1554 (-),score=340.11 TRINITY_DN1239_c0_g1_i6:73-4713(-)